MKDLSMFLSNGTRRSAIVQFSTVMLQYNNLKRLRLTKTNNLSHESPQSHSKECSNQQFFFKKILDDVVGSSKNILSLEKK
jgi:hypothetical protein